MVWRHSKERKRVFFFLLLVIFCISSFLALCGRPFQAASSDPLIDVIQKPFFSGSYARVRIAIVIPVVNCQILSRLKPNLLRWTEVFPGKLPSGSDVSIIFHYNKFAKENPGVLHDLSTVWYSLPRRIRNIFREVNIWSADLSDSQDDYVMGTCVMFHRTFPLLHSAKYTHWFQYEPDVKPIRPGWLSRIAELSIQNADCTLWWQLGSEPCYRSVTDFVKIADTLDVDLHINGNALYCVSSSDFAKYRAAVREAYPPLGCKGDSVIGEVAGWDHALYRYRHSHDRRKFREHSKFRLDPLIRNFGTETTDIEEILAAYPSTYLVHGKRVMETKRLSEEKEEETGLALPLERKVHDIFWRAFGRQASRNEMNFWVKTLRDVSDTGLLRKRMGQLQTICQERKIPRELQPLFSSLEHAAAGAAFVTTAHRFPFPQELQLVSETVEISTGGNHFGDYEESTPVPTDLALLVTAVCDISITLACKTEKATTKRRRGYFDRHCPHNLQDSIKHKLPVGCHIHHMSPSSLVAVCDGATAAVPNPIGCVLFGKHKEGLICEKSLVWHFPSYTPYLRSLSHVGHNKYFAAGDFESLFQDLYKGTTFSAGTYAETMDDTFHLAEDFLARQQKILWVTDFHAAPSMCNSNIFSHLNLYLNAKIDFGNCEHFTKDDGGSVCANQNGLKALAFDNWNGFGLHPCPKNTREEFFFAYRHDEEFASASAVMCSHPVANCELYMPFSKPIILYATTRIEFGRNDKFVPWRNHWVKHEDKAQKAWSHWLNNLLAIASDPQNRILANNLYDAKYIEYFTGIKPVVLPSWCGPSGKQMHPSRYRPTQTDVLLTPYRTNLEYQAHNIPRSGWPDMDGWTSISAPLSHPIFDDLFAEVKSREMHTFRLNTIQNAFPDGYEHISDLSNFPVFLFIPYQASTMSFFELYRLNVPMLVPSKTLLLKWMSKHRIMFERVYGQPDELLRKQASPSIPSPNSFEIDDARVWVNFYDIYQEDTFPHLLYFESWANALDILTSINLEEVSRAMKDHNRNEFFRIVRLWEIILSDLPNKPEKSGVVEGDDFASALYNRYGATPPHDDLPECRQEREKHERIQLLSQGHPHKFFSKCDDDEAEQVTRERSDRTDVRFLHAVTHGDFASQCLKLHYSQETDTLSCDDGTRTMLLRDPYSCDDIRVTGDGQLLCF